MGSKLSVYLAKIWMKQFEPILSGQGPLTGNWSQQPVIPQKDDEICGKCKKKVTLRGYSAQCINCATWFHRKCTNLSLQPETLSSPPCFFARYVHDIIRTINEERAKMLHPNLELTIEKENNELPFRDMLIKRDNGKLSSSWYSKPTDTGVTMNPACAPTKYKWNIVEESITPQHHG